MLNNKRLCSHSAGFFFHQYPNFSFLSIFKTKYQNWTGTEENCKGKSLTFKKNFFAYSLAVSDDLAGGEQQKLLWNYNILMMSYFHMTHNFIE